MKILKNNDDLLAILNLLLLDIIILASVGNSALRISIDINIDIEDIDNSMILESYLGKVYTTDYLTPKELSLACSQAEKKGQTDGSKMGVEVDLGVLCEALAYPNPSASQASSVLSKRRS